MRILYAIQGTGNGHLSRARDVIPCLQKHGEVDVLVSGIQTELQLPWPVKYRYYGLSFIFGKKGGIALGTTLRKLRPLRFLRDVWRLDLQQYELIITDFEPVSAWACRLRGKKCYGMSHQSAFLSASTPRPPGKKASMAEFILKHYAPITDYQGFHFRAYSDKITTPVIREEVRQLQPRSAGPILVYLPAYADEVLLAHFGQLPEMRWFIFSKHSKQAYQVGNCHIAPIDNAAYLQQLAACSGLVTGGGFEAPAEALFLGKKIMLIPMKGQYEQQANAAAAEALGACVLPEIQADFATRLRQWLLLPAPTAQNFPNNTQEVVDRALKKWHSPENA